MKEKWLIKFQEYCDNLSEEELKNYGNILDKFMFCNNCCCDCDKEKKCGEAFIRMCEDEFNFTPDFNNFDFKNLFKGYM